MKKLKFNYRKLGHYGLLICVVFLQLMVIVIWYNEKINETKNSKNLDAISSSDKISNLVNEINSSLLNSQEHFNHYINYKDRASLNQYTAALNRMTSLVDSLSFSTKNNMIFKNILSKKNITEEEIIKLNSTIRSILENKGRPNLFDALNFFKLDKFEYKSILDDIKISSNKEIDSIEKKGFFSRLGNALAGKQDIQKEITNVTVTMKYKDRITSGSIENQMKNLFLTTNEYYENEFKNLKKTFSSLREKDLKLVELNSKLMNLSQFVLLNYNNAANNIKTDSQKKLVDQYHSNKVVRNYTIIILMVLMLIISIILFNYTRMAFVYEKKIVTAKNEIQQSLNFKNRIMGMISHEVRSPLSILSIYSKKISTTIKDPEIKDCFNSIEFTTNSLLLLTNQILEYSKSEKHKFKLNNKKFNLKTEIDQIITSLASLVESKGNKIKLYNHVNTDYEVYSDATKIHQLFYNIVGNANKFTNKGLIWIAINLETISDYEMNLKVEVQDTGPGISKHDLEHVFESYYQGTVSEIVNDFGVGLGLNLCKEIVELFNGNITIESEEINGTKVTFNLVLCLI